MLRRQGTNLFCDQNGCKGGSRLSGGDISQPPDHVFVTNCFLTVDLERKIGITEVPFGRTGFDTICLKLFSRSIAQARSRRP